jgi:hypothetical protein
MASRLPVLPSRPKRTPTELTSSFLLSRASTPPLRELFFSSLMSYSSSAAMTAPSRVRVRPRRKSADTP